MFDEFDPVSAKQWKQKIQFDLKGADYNDALIWQSPEGIHVKPFYHRDDFSTPFAPIPGHPRQWKIAQAVFIDDEAIARSLALDSAIRGAEAICFTADKVFDFKKLFLDFPFGKVTIYFQFGFLDADFTNQLISYLSEKNTRSFYNIDLLGNLAKSGNWYHNKNKDHQQLETILSAYPSEEIISIDTSLYQNAGANSVQQLAYALAHANEYLNHFDKNDKLKVTFKVAVGSNYFFEIAKIRALRILYATLATEYGIQETCHILASPTRRNKTVYEYNSNMLRTTTEAMSAILGGADAVCNQPYDALYHKSNEFGERISRNQLLVLKSESYFDQVSNIADGSYYIESLTNDLAQKALELFKEIEKTGGFLKQLLAGAIQKKIKESAQKEQQLFDEGKLILVGSNKYVNTNDRMKDHLELYPFVKRNPRKTILEPILEKRLSEELEQQRLNDE